MKCYCKKNLEHQVSYLNMVTKNPSCWKVPRTLLKNDDTLLEFRRIWRFLTEVGVLDHILDVFL